MELCFNWGFFCARCVMACHCPYCRLAVEQCAEPTKVICPQCGMSFVATMGKEWILGVVVILATYCFVLM